MKSLQTQGGVSTTQCAVQQVSANDNDCMITSVSQSKVTMRRDQVKREGFEPVSPSQVRPQPAQVNGQVDLPVDAKNDTKVKAQSCEELSSKPLKTESTRVKSDDQGPVEAKTANTEGEGSRNEDTKVAGDGSNVDQGGVEAKA